MQRSRSKSKGKEITCFECGRKGHKKPDYRFYKQELERKKKYSKNTIEKTHDVDNKNGKEREKANRAFGVIIEEMLDNSICIVSCTRLYHADLGNRLWCLLSLHSF